MPILYGKKYSPQDCCVNIKLCLFYSKMSINTTVAIWVQLILEFKKYLKNKIKYILTFIVHLKLNYKAIP